jgi:predicted SnoaL-like aldol condensation-catalyzing enzyme
VVVVEITKERIYSFYEGFFNQKKFELVNDLIAENYVQHNRGVEQGREGFIKAFKKKFESDEFFHLKVDQIVLDKEFAAVFLRSVDEQHQAKCYVVDLYRISQNQFVEHWDYFDRRKT